MSQPSHQTAAAPFDNRCNADVVFLTVDHVRFYLHKTVLSLASTFFEGMFTLSQPTPTETQTCDGLPVVEVSEDSTTLAHIFRHCYPVQECTINDLQVLDRVLGAAIKYALDATITFFTRTLRGFIETHPLQVYAIACRHRCEEEARLSAVAWKRTREAWPASANTFAETSAALCFVPEIGNLPAGVYFRLIQFLVSATDENLRFCDPPPGADVRLPPVDIAGYPFNQASADIVLRSADGVDFKVHRIMIEAHIAANPVFPLPATLLSAPLADVTIDGLSVIKTEESSTILSTLLKILYPSPLGCFTAEWGSRLFSVEAVNVIASARRYGLTPLVERYQQCLSRSMGANLLAYYCVCVALGLDDSMTLAVRPSWWSSLIPQPTYDPILELISSSEYRRFLELTWRQPIRLFG